MSDGGLPDHSPHHPDPADPLPSAANLILIDNYDSFTWNVYQYLVLEGAGVKVFRNDKISLQELIDLQPTQLVISPGPGHPQTDSGISRDAIRHFASKIPVLGVCMGEQCILSVFGGEVVFAGEILHGKTSPLRHDGKGLYRGLRQDLPVTRYHSLAGTHPSVPSCLEVSSWIPSSSDGGKGVIMGVRHKEFVVEGVQFHPESILTEEGRAMLKNFLAMRGGSWAENVQGQDIGPGPHLEAAAVSSIPSENKQSILDEIYRHRRDAVAMQMQLPSHRLSDLQAAYDLGLAPPMISFPSRLRQSPFPLSLMAEIKRASPSKGVISMSTCAPRQARSYALAGASVISVLTEPHWFKGSLDDLRMVRRALECMPNRPAVLRKEFIFDEYQILEARLAGADTILLIVKMLDADLLTRLYRYSQSLGMEPLVEVNNIPEMEVARGLGATVIGVNNRNLTNFDVDLNTTTKLMERIPEHATVCALSGISGPRDVEAYMKAGVGAVLVGEALMRASNVKCFVQTLLSDRSDREAEAEAHQQKLLVKVCGTRTPEAAKMAIEAGADIVGMILVEGRRRYVDEKGASEISRIVHGTAKGATGPLRQGASPMKATDHFEHAANSTLRHPVRALLAGVFQNQPLEHILDQQRLLNLDIVQLHGSEPLEWASLIPVPVIRRFHPKDAETNIRGYHALPLLDAGAGGSGERLELSEISQALARDDGMKVMLAGGLDADNLRETFEALGSFSERVVAVDVSSGVEVNGTQNADKIRAFVRNAKALR